MFVVTPFTVDTVVLDGSTGLTALLLPGYQRTVGVGLPPVDEHDNDTEFPSTIKVGALITGGPGTTVKFYV